MSNRQTNGTNGHDLADVLRSRAQELRRRPQSGLALNAILALAAETSQNLEQDPLAINDLRVTVKRLMDRAAHRRAIRLSRKSKHIGRDALAAFEARVGASAESLDWESFNREWSHPRCGVVFTAHPTFAMSRDLFREVTIAANAKIDPGRLVAFAPAHCPDSELRLTDEHRASGETISNFHDAYRRLVERFLDVACRRFPENWRALEPSLVTCASWVGYDLDGRTDIDWNDTFVLRLSEKAATLASYRDRLLAIAHGAGSRFKSQQDLQTLADHLKRGVERTERILRLFRDGRGNVAQIVAAANELTAPNVSSIVSLKDVSRRLKHIAEQSDDQRTARDLLVLAGMMRLFGPAGRHIHMRVNAKQLHNAFHSHIGEAWSRDIQDRAVIRRIGQMITNAKPIDVNFGCVMNEPTTAIRQFTAAAQLIKHVDADTPIRFLVAECEQPATIMIAIYFAKLFGVDGALDISPLFETDMGLDHGATIMEHLLVEKHYVNYARMRRRISIQTGFSDAGRFIGQLPATLAVERLQLRIAQLVTGQGLSDLEVVVFNTHGESMGRGSHPGGYLKRFRYVLSDHARQCFKAGGIRLVHEISFQGGDGFVNFGTPALSLATGTSLILDSVDHPGPAAEDPFYTDLDLYHDFFNRLREFHQRVYKDPGYRSLLAAFGPNLLFKTGSRAMKRQHELGGSSRADPARMRAIPNNALLQQFGYLSNVVAGIGSSLSEDVGRFVDIVRRSTRLGDLMEMVATAKRLSSVSTLAAYAALLDPELWASLAHGATGRQPINAYETIAAHLLADDRSRDIGRFVQFLRLDALRLHRILEHLGMSKGDELDRDRLEQDVLHAIRIALIMHVFVMAARVPEFASRNDVSHEQFMSAVLSLEIEAAVDFLRRAFPPSNATALEQFDEPATYQPWQKGGYSALEENVFGPMMSTYALIREIGVGISHNFDAYG
jgi:phosphoenolpyruvate carboxylase